MRPVRACLLAMTLLLPAAAGPGAAAPGTVGDLGAHWIEQQFDDDGAVIGRTGSPDVATTIAAVLALQSTGHVPPDRRATVEYVHARVDDYVRDGLDDYAPIGPGDRPGSLANLVLFALAVGEDPGDFGGHDLVARLQATEQAIGPDAGSFGRQVDVWGHGYVHATVVLALGRAPGVEPSAAALAHLVDLQCASGGFPSGYRSLPQRVLDDCTGDSNATGLALAALGATAPAGLPSHASARDDAVAFLLGVANEDGGWGYTPGDPTDGNSTGLAAFGLRSVGRDVTGGVRAIGALQFGCDDDRRHLGGVRFVGTDAVPNPFATYQAMLALEAVADADSVAGAEPAGPCPA